MTLELRRHQLEAREAVLQHWATIPDKGAMVVAGAGSGKTILGLNIAIEDVLTQGGRVLWMAHREELVTQPLAPLRKFWPQYARRAGVVRGTKNQIDRAITFASTPTLRRAGRLEAILEHGAIDLLIWDEVHNALGSVALGIQDALGFPGGLRALGLTATPYDPPGSVASLFDRWDIAYHYGFMDALEDRVVVRPWSHVDGIGDQLARVSTSEDDEELTDAQVEAMIGLTVEKLTGPPIPAESLPWRDQTQFVDPKGRVSLIFTATVDAAKRTAAALVRAGLNAVAVSGETPKAQRRKIVTGLHAGQIVACANASVFTEGTDIPRVDLVVMARPFRSRTLWEQALCRGCRTFPAKEDCLVLDLTGCTQRHSLVAAPVLLKDGCPATADGEHRWAPDPDRPGRAICTACGESKPCWASIQAGFGGNHSFVDGRCEHCGEHQCPGDPSEGEEPGVHRWNTDDVVHFCEKCGKTREDTRPNLALQDARQLFVPNKSIVFLRAAEDPSVLAIDCRPNGWIFIRQESDDGELATVFWVPKGGRRARPLSSKPVDKRTARALWSNILQRIEPREHHAARKRQKWGGQRSKQTQSTARLKARERAVALGIVDAPMEVPA